ncbi:MAG: nuclease-related domain-containing protein, partial [Rhodoglobus sp.]
IVVGPSGVFVIDAKKYKGRPNLRIEGGLFRPRIETLMVGSRDCTTLADRALKQVAQVASALAAAGIHDLPTAGMLCFVEADWPLLGGNFTTRGVEVLWPAKAMERMQKPGPLDDTGIAAAARALAAHFPTA